MNLFTKTEIGENPEKIHHNERILTIGSCFAENIGQTLVENKFLTLCNPFGTVYNPSSILSCITRLHKNSYVITKELQLCQDYHCHPDFHSQFNSIDKHATVEGINNAIQATSTFVNEGLDWLIISLGTAFVYRNKSSNKLVNNCHKFPASEFDREFLDSTLVLDTLLGSVDQLRETNPNLRVILTVSPIRHIRDGLSANLRSKSRLIEACHLMTEKIENCFYFPSYEIMIEELRDYRWYKQDLIHPTDQAIDYIWSNFKKFALTAESLKLVEKMDHVHKNLNHKPFLAESSQHQKFLINTQSKIEELANEYPHLNFDVEKMEIAGRL